MLCISDVTLANWQHNLMPPPPRERFLSESDHLVLEDEGTRIRLEGDIDPQQYVNGR